MKMSVLHEKQSDLGEMAHHSIFKTATLSFILATFMSKFQDNEYNLI